MNHNVHIRSDGTGSEHLFRSALDAGALKARPLRPTPPPPVARASGDRRKHFVAGVLQTIGLYFVYGVRGLHWVTPFLVFFLLLASEHSALVSALWAAASAVAIFPVLLALAIGVKWLVLGQARPGRYPLWGSYFL